MAKGAFSVYEDAEPPVKARLARKRLELSEYSSHATYLHVI